ncbi:GNAT family N-acetyltransferase [Fictibacillus phosphorivorans]|uniref:GNAT family N-acetyltransferase n=1 Tax=Fictibacillus phosphorivorans TaxID=1221500 RepID=UPI00203CA3EA|nr:GNAT family N-acetyltransferase [Fictibacillus phosphorivorans]MCM3719029.1 GNAT family N-acetyltransferase [Fictibacillus phosphorivorans]MCM3776651.1 GNAT family N-acetyltransferase [Fictibacillus phosphorivorans]
MEIIQMQDYELVATLNKNVQDVHVELFPESFTPYKYEPIRDYFKEIMMDSNQLFLVVKEDTTPIGYVWLTLRHSAETPFKKASKSLYIHQISIDKNHSNKGAGSQVIAYIEKLGKQLGVTKIELDYWIENKIAKNFYKKIGFMITREVVHKEIN